MTSINPCLSEYNRAYYFEPGSVNSQIINNFYKLPIKLKNNSILYLKQKLTSYSSSLKELGINQVLYSEQSTHIRTKFIKNLSYNYQFYHCFGLSITQQLSLAISLLLIFISLSLLHFLNPITSLISCLFLFHLLNWIAFLVIQTLRNPSLNKNKN